MNSDKEFWTALVVCDTDVYLYIYVIIILSYRFYCLLNDLTVEIYLLHDIWIIKDKISTYSCNLLLQVPFYCNVSFIDLSDFKCMAFKIDFP